MSNPDLDNVEPGEVSRPLCEALDLNDEPCGEPCLGDLRVCYDHAVPDARTGEPSNPAELKP